MKIMAPAKPLVDALARRRELWFDGKLGSALQEIPLNVLLATIIVMLGLLAIFITPILPLLVLCVVAFMLSFNRKATARFGRYTSACKQVATGQHTAKQVYGKRGN